MTSNKISLQAEMLGNRLQKRYRHLRKWAQRLNISAYRLYDRDIPEIPLVLDLYGDAVSGALYKRPYEKDEAEEAQWLDTMHTAIAQSLCFKHENIIIKRREHQREKSQYEKIASQGLTRIITEGIGADSPPLRFKVNLSDYLDTGLFLDTRALRRMVNADSNGKRVLNLFCYTGSFSVHAAVGNAASTDSVDLSNTYLNWARENFSLNGFSTDDSSSHRLIRADAGDFLGKALQSQRGSSARRWDTIILDPPAFSNSAMAADFDLNRDYEQLLVKCLNLLSPNGKVWFNASSRSFKPDAEALTASLRNHFPAVTVTDITRQTIDEDFKNRKTPRSFIISTK